MADQYDEQDPVITPIRHYNALEEAANRYWRASRIWRDKEESNWNYGMMIQELREIRCYRGLVPLLASNLMEDVVHDRRQPVLNLQPENILSTAVAANEEGTNV